MLSMDRFPDQSQINELLRRMTPENVEELREVYRDLFIKHSLILSEPWRIIVDIDQTGLTAEGETFELTEKGYFPEKRGTEGYKLSAAYVGGDSNVHCISRFDDLFEDIKLCLKGISPDSQVVSGRIRATARRILSISFCIVSISLLSKVVPLKYQ